MKYVQERFARELHGDLAKHFASTDPTVEVSVSGAGVHWCCEVKRDKRLSEINCFDGRFDGSEAEYLSEFREGDQTIVWGRTNSKADTITAASNWVRGDSLANLEAQFEFVDGQKRRLLKIAQALVEYSPQSLKGLPQEVRRLSCDLCELWFTEGDRDCKLSFYGKNEFADAIFRWDRCELFRLRAEDNVKLAAVLMRWLCDRSKPSLMRSDFPWLEIGELADYYEKGKPIEGEFVMSWNSIEHFYAKLEFPLKEQILRMLAEMRQRGYDRSLRAGQSMSSFILSRSRRHGLRQHQPCLIFSFKGASMEICARFDKEENFPMPQIALSPQVDGLLRRLVGTQID